MTLLLGRISTWRLPRFSALCRDFRQSARTLMRTILEAGFCASHRKPLQGFGWRRVQRAVRMSGKRPRCSSTDHHVTRTPPKWVALLQKSHRRSSAAWRRLTAAILSDLKRDDKSEDRPNSGPPSSAASGIQRIETPRLASGRDQASCWRRAMRYTQEGDIDQSPTTYATHHPTCQHAFRAVTLQRPQPLRAAPEALGCNRSTPHLHRFYLRHIIALSARMCRSNSPPSTDLHRHAPSADRHS